MDFCWQAFTLQINTRARWWQCDGASAACQLTATITPCCVPLELQKRRMNPSSRLRLLWNDSTPMQNVLGSLRTEVHPRIERAYSRPGDRVMQHPTTRKIMNINNLRMTVSFSLNLQMPHSNLHNCLYLYWIVLLPLTFDFLTFFGSWNQPF